MRFDGLSVSEKLLTSANCEQTGTLAEQHEGPERLSGAPNMFSFISVVICYAALTKTDFHQATVRNESPLPTPTPYAPYGP